MTSVWILETIYTDNKRQNYLFSTLEKAKEALEEEKLQAWDGKNENSPPFLHSEVYTTNVKSFRIYEEHLDDY